MKRLFILMSILTALFISCSEQTFDEEIGEMPDGRVKLNLVTNLDDFSISSRASINSGFALADTIMVCISDEPYPTNFCNCKHVLMYQRSFNGGHQLAEDIYFPDGDTTKLHIFAFYPHNALQIGDTLFSGNSENMVYNVSNFNDIITAQAYFVEKTTNQVKLNFKHDLSIIRFRATDNNKNVPADSISNLYLTGIKSNFGYLANGSYMGVMNGGSDTLFFKDNNHIIIPNQTLGQLHFTYNGNPYNVGLNLETKSGMSHLINATFSHTKLSLSTSIKEWNIGDSENVHIPL